MMSIPLLAALFLFLFSIPLMLAGGFLMRLLSILIEEWFHQDPVGKDALSRIKTVTNYCASLLL